IYLRMSEIDNRRGADVREELIRDRQEFVSEQEKLGVDPFEARDAYTRDLLAIGRDISGRDYFFTPSLPQLPETWAYQIFERIEAAEHALITPNQSPDDYEYGTATQPDDIAETHTNGSRLIVVTAEHATWPVRADGRGNADVGTGGLAAVLGEDFGHGIIMTGDQTSNAPKDPDHKI